jgi:FkbM family methyltransferase
VCGSRTLTIEPVPATFAALMDNVRLNNLSERVQAHNIGLDKSSGTITFTADLDTVNHVVAQGESVGSTITVPVRPLDEIAATVSPALIKIDVEGLETSVIEGAERTLRQPSLLAVLMELNGSGARYGFDDSALHERMGALGFTAAQYDPRKRLLQTRDFASKGAGNIVYVRRWDELQSRLIKAPRYQVAGTAL